MNKLEEGDELKIQFKKRGGTVPVIVTDIATLKPLMLAYTNKEAFNLTLKTGFAHFYSTSRQMIWKKGETSGDLLKINAIKVDCDQDALWYEVEMIGEGACHTTDPVTGKHRHSCFYRVYEDGKLRQ